MDHADIERILGMAETLSTSAAHRLAMGSDSTEACPYPGCVLSAAEHHRLAYGILAENKDLKRRLEAFEHGTAEVSDAFDPEDEQAMVLLALAFASTDPEERLTVRITQAVREMRSR
jgi:hypothetical protein